MAPGEKPSVVLNEKELQARLDPLSYKVLRKEGTEVRGKHEYITKKDKGTYVCKACGQALFPSTCKYVDGSGWPAFKDALPGAVLNKGLEIVCSACHSHLGHMFPDDQMLQEYATESTVVPWSSRSNPSMAQSLSSARRK
eukprot:CAMPEP_0174381546 /NCGR_PEP_ID=MMETSP0811_2-20130205/124079_1 /TAXON_ID=73025 ORGANISM="Eutreptiella gymnastica-like, Strain CCMP1594" /NCGR_SAMPLE_ID=MMETSP0811_2 /ASSEMBLY_ACC=CAM_ASM_000667 /LENGTH=139 /DNA_ID=CAMNT_0015534719 /DNA_START=57 /DNA_END=477 /DNA_ORIENTATION=+